MTNRAGAEARARMAGCRITVAEARRAETLDPFS
jgi:hypothetical protein